MGFILKDLPRSIALVTALNFVCLLLVVTSLAVGWAPGPGTTDLGGGWTADTSTAGTLAFKLNGVSAEEHTANGIVTRRIAVGAAGSVLPTNIGQISIAESAAPGTPAANTAYIYLDSTSDDATIKFDDAGVVGWATHP
jgi:hypothetical protein